MAGCVEEDADEWLFLSVKKYKELYIYDLQMRTTAMNWVDHNKVCVASSNGKKHELLELTLPDRILFSSEDNRLMKNRDIAQTCGGFTQTSLLSLLQIPGTNLVLAAQDVPQHLVDVYSFHGDDSDLVKKTDQFTGKTSNDPTLLALVPKQQSFLFGCTLADLQFVADIGVNKYICPYIQDKASENLATTVFSGLFFMDPNTLTACEKHTGGIHTLDFREGHLHPQGATPTPSGPAGQWVADIRDQYIALASREGLLCVKDQRKMSDMIVCTQTNARPKITSTLPVCVKICGDSVSVSGIDENVYIYKGILTSHAHMASCCYVHDGHRALAADTQGLATSHVVHPTRTDLFISYANDASIHAWEMNYDITT